MREYRALGDPRRAAGVLQEGDVLVGEFHIRSSACVRPAASTALKLDGAGKVPGRHLLVHPAHDEIYDGGFRKSEQLPDAGCDDMPDRGARQHRLQHMGEVLQHHDGERSRRP